MLAIDEVARKSHSDITDADAQAAGAAGGQEILARLGVGGPGTLYRIRFHHLGDDPRILRAQASDPDEDAKEEIRGQLDQLDARSRRGPSTRATLALIAAHPGVRAAELAAFAASAR